MEKRVLIKQVIELELSKAGSTQIEHVQGDDHVTLDIGGQYGEPGTLYKLTANDIDALIELLQAARKSL